MLRTHLSFCVVGLLLAGMGALAAETPKGERKPAPAPLGPPTKRQIQAARKAGKVQVKLETEKGTILLELDGKAAPTAVANFLNLVNAGFYDGMPFHRVVREPSPFVIQAGDPARVGKPAAGYTIPDEQSPLKHDKAGVIAMARLSGPSGMIPDSASTQFYITLAPTPHLDPLGFAVFGHVVKGMEVADKIRVNDKIKKATVVRKAEK